MNKPTAMSVPYRPTERELEIIQFLSRGHSSKEIAQSLALSVHTVDTHRRNIIKKMSVSNSSEALSRCMKMGWI